MKLTHPSPAMVVAVAALVVSLGGSATAASVLITSSAQIGSGSITSSDIRNGAIKRRDLDAGLRPLRGIRGPEGAPGPAGPAGPAGADASPSAVSVSQLADATSTLNDASWDDIAALTQTITVPAGRPRRLLVTVSGESECSTADPVLGNYCMLRIVIDGTQELAPKTGEDFAFNSPDPDVGEEKGSWESLSIQRTSDILAPGQHTVTVQHRVTTGGEPVRHRFDDAVLSVLQFETSP
jgi:hypothetical protein